MERALQLCARAAPTPEQQVALTAALAEGVDWERLAARAEEEGLGALLFEHLAGQAGVPRHARAVARALQMRHRHAHEKRVHVMVRVLDALERAGVHALLLKGSAVAHLVYPRPFLRVMRDVDVLVRADEARRAAEALAGIGFTCPKEDWDEHYHLEPRYLEHEGVVVSVELHRKVQWELPWTLDELWPASVEVALGDRTARTLGALPTLLLAYVHGFCLSLKKSESFRLVWVADVHALVEQLAARGELAAVRSAHPKLWRALPWFGAITPWSDDVAGALDSRVAPLPTAGPFSDVPLSSWRSRPALERARHAPRAWAGIRHGLPSRRVPELALRLGPLWAAWRDR